MYSGSSHIQNIFAVFTYFEKNPCFFQGNFCRHTKIEIFQNPEMKIFAFSQAWLFGETF